MKMKKFPEHLLNGYKNFMQSRFNNEQNLYRELAVDGQKPEVMMISCCDSRAAPEMIFDANIGEIFVMRNVAGQVPPFQPDGEYHATSAALEYAVRFLEVKHIVVMGHGRCGGIRAALDMQNESLQSDDFIGRWMSLIKPAAEAISGDTTLSANQRQTALERISLRYSLNNLLTFPWINERQKAGLLQLHAVWFDILYGELWVLDEESGQFIKITIDDAA